MSGVRETEQWRRQRPDVIFGVHAIQNVKGIDTEFDPRSVLVFCKVKRSRQVRIDLGEAWPTPGVSIDSRGTVIRNRIVVVVDACGDVIGYPGIQNHDRPKPKRKRQTIADY